MIAPRILVIRHSALGDIAQSFAPFAAIRAHHQAAHIALLTTRPYAAWLAAAPWFDAVETDTRPGLLNWPALRRLRRQFAGLTRVYDLQTSARSTRYRWLAGRAEWSGIGRLASHPHRNPDRDHIHTFARQREQLRDAGITHIPTLTPTDLAPLTRAPNFPLPARFIVLVPGAAPHRPEKRWPAEHFAALAATLAGRGHAILIAGTAAEAPLATTIRAAVPHADNLIGRTTLPELAFILSCAACVIGNDTGPMHLAAAFSRPALVLFGGASNPALTAPRYPDGTAPAILAVPHLADLPPARVAAALPLPP